MPLPNFLVIGAAKSGTTSLHRYLREHPEIYVPARREPSFFAHEGEELHFKGPGDDEWSFVTDVESYQRLFEGAEGYTAVGELSPRYLYFRRSSERIQRYIPDARLVVILRHPVDRAYSHFLMNRDRLCEPEPDFATALGLGSKRAQRGWGWDWQYVEAGLYHKQLKRYYSVFDVNKIRVFLYEEYKSNPNTFFSELFAFLGVDASFRPDTSVRHRQAAIPRIPVLRALLDRPNVIKSWAIQVFPYSLVKDMYSHVKRSVREWNRVTPDPLSPMIRDELFDRFFEADCTKLEALIGRDLSEWRGVKLDDKK